MLHLALASQSSSQHTAPKTARDERRTLIPQLRRLADELALILQSGQTTQARQLTRQLRMPPIAWGFLAACLQKKHIPAKTIEGLLS